MSHSFNYEKAKERIDSLFNSENIDIEIQCCCSMLYMMLYEHMKYLLIDNIISFLSDDYINLETPKKSKKYIESCKIAGGAFEYGFEFYQLNDEQKRFLRKSQQRRGNATHHFLSTFINEDHFSFDELKQFFDIINHIDNYWTVNIEIATSIDNDYTYSDIDNAHSIYFMLIQTVSQRIFALITHVKGM